MSRRSDVSPKRRFQNDSTFQFFRPECFQNESTVPRFCISNLSAKLQRESIRYREVVELADVLGYDIVWQKRRER